MTSGRRKHLIRIERETETGRDSLNAPVVEWSLLAERWASAHFGAGREQREAAQLNAIQAASFEVLHDPDTAGVTAKDRVVFDGAVWEIKSVAPLGFNEGVKINAVRVI